MREFIWPAIDKRSFLGNCFKCDDYPDRIGATPVLCMQNYNISLILQNYCLTFSCQIKSAVDSDVLDDFAQSGVDVHNISKLCKRDILVHEGGYLLYHIGCMGT